MSARTSISLAPGFSRVFPATARVNRFNGLPGRPAETVETVPASLSLTDTWLKPCANEMRLAHPSPLYPCHPHQPRATSSPP